MIAEFVDGLLQTIREATIEELRELLAAEPQRRLPAESAQTPPRTAPGLHGRVMRVDRRLNKPTIEGSSAFSSVAEITDPESLLSLGRTPGAAHSVAPPRPGQRAWWDPPSLPPEGEPRAPTGSAASPRTAAAASESAAAPESAPDLEVDCPASNVWPVGGSAPVRLSDNETLARVSNSGIVIRRRKKA
jgi:hypothetical protein